MNSHGAQSTEASSPPRPISLPELAQSNGKGAGEEGQLGRNPLASWNPAFLTLRITHSRANSF